MRARFLLLLIVFFTFLALTGCYTVLRHPQAVGETGFTSDYYDPDECSTCHIDDENLVVMLRDHGTPFDPSAVKAPRLGVCLDDRESGGLGLYFMHRLMDEVRFEFDPESGNVVTLVKRKETSS